MVIYDFINITNVTLRIKPHLYTENFQNKVKQAKNQLSSQNNKSMDGEKEKFTIFLSWGQAASLSSVVRKARCSEHTLVTYSLVWPGALKTD